MIKITVKPANRLSKGACSCRPSRHQHYRCSGHYFQGFYSMRRLGIFLLPLDGMLVHSSVTPPPPPPALCLPVAINTPGWREALWVRVKCLAQEHNTMCQNRTGTHTAWSRAECTNHEAATCCYESITLACHLYITKFSRLTLQEFYGNWLGEFRVQA